MSGIEQLCETGDLGCLQGLAELGAAGDGYTLGYHRAAVLGLGVRWLGESVRFRDCDLDLVMVMFVEVWLAVSSGANS